MGKGRGLLIVRQKSALKRLEAAYEKFKAAGEDKKPWDSTRNGFPVHHKGRSYNEECERLKKEISILKDKISRTHI